MLFSKDGVGQRFQSVSDQIPYRLRVGRILVFTALRISNDAVVNGVDFELDLSICILHRQREAWGDRPTVRRPRERRTFRNRPVGAMLTSSQLTQILDTLGIESAHFLAGKRRC